MNDKFYRLKQTLTEMGSVVVAYSGGVDSTFFLKVAHDCLGEKTLAITAVSASLAASDRPDIPSQIPQMLPYVLTIIVLAGVVGRAIPPAADGQPYEKQ